MKHELTKEDFERLEAILKKLPEAEAGEHVDFHNAAELSKFLTETTGSLMDSFGLGIREGLYAAVTYLCVYLTAIKESMPELSDRGLEDIFQELFSALRKEVRELHEGEIDERNRKEPPIGTIIEHDGMHYRVIPDEDVVTSSDEDECAGCAFLNPETGECNAPKIFCTEDYRSDGKNVKFVLVEPPTFEESMGEKKMEMEKGGIA